jgi:hypothetical protein
VETGAFDRCHRGSRADDDLTWRVARIHLGSGELELAPQEQDVLRTVGQRDRLTFTYADRLAGLADGVEDIWDLDVDGVLAWLYRIRGVAPAGLLFRPAVDPDCRLKDEQHPVQREEARMDLDGSLLHARPAFDLSPEQLKS